MYVIAYNMSAFFCFTLGASDPPISQPRRAMLGTCGRLRGRGAGTMDGLMEHPMKMDDVYVVS